MSNCELQTSPQTLYAERDWDEEYGKEYNYSKTSLNNKLEEDSSRNNLHFVDTDVKEESSVANQRHRYIPSRTRKSSPREISKFSSADQNLDVQESAGKKPSSTVNRTRSSLGIHASSRDFDSDSENDDFSKTSRPQSKPLKPIDQTNKTASSLSYNVTHTNSTILPSSSVKRSSTHSVDLSKRFQSTLTFGDTQDLFEKLEDDTQLKSTANAQTMNTKTSSYSAEIGKSLENKPTNPNEPSEMDIFLYSFIRHEPASNINDSNVLDLTAVRQSDPNEFYSSPASLAHSSQNFDSNHAPILQQTVSVEQQPPVLNGLVNSTLPGGIQMSNDRDSGSSSASPLPNITPFGSLETEIPFGARTGVPAPNQFVNPYAIDNQEILIRQLLHPNLPLATNPDYSSVPTTPYKGMIAINPQGQPQYRLPSNPAVPLFQDPNALLLQQAQLQQAQLQQAQLQQAQLQQAQLQQAQLQQALLQQAQYPPGYYTQVLSSDAPQLSASPVDSDDNSTGKHENTIQTEQQNSHHLFNHNQAQILSQPQTPYSQMSSQAQLLSQPQPQISQIPAQLLPSNQAHLFPLPQLLSLQNQPQQMGMATPKQEELVVGGQLGGRTQEELQMEYQNALLALRRVQEKMQEANLPRSLPVSQAPMCTQPWGVIPPSPGVTANQFFSAGVMQIPPQLVQQTQTNETSQGSPPIQGVPQNLPGPTISRGRGRFP